MNTYKKHRNCKVSHDENEKNRIIEKKSQNREKRKQIKEILTKNPADYSKEEINALDKFSDVVKSVRSEERRINCKLSRDLEFEDPPDVLEHKCSQLVEALQNAKKVIVYTGAGISTAARIPDYRGPNGVWTLLEKGETLPNVEVSKTEPTLTHMSLTKLYEEKIIHHLVSQNCDGLHVRSGFPRPSLSEIHGNMFIEVCLECDPMREYIRLFDVTEKTARHRHTTGRFCHICKSDLKDTIVHFTELGYIPTPLNWSGAMQVVQDTDLILCLGSSLKILKEYKCLWCMNRSVSRRPKLFIVNLQWTPKDNNATLKINGKCDKVMKLVMSKLNLDIPAYNLEADILFNLHTPLREIEEGSYTKQPLSKWGTSDLVLEESSSHSGWYGCGLKPKNASLSGRKRKRGKLIQK